MNVIVKIPDPRFTFGYRHICNRDQNGRFWCPAGSVIHKGEKHSFGVYPEVGDECPICGAIVTEAVFGVGGGR
jgi:hypothetical protein